MGQHCFCHPMGLHLLSTPDADHFRCTLPSKTTSMRNGPWCANACLMAGHLLGFLNPHPWDRHRTGHLIKTHDGLDKSKTQRKIMFQYLLLLQYAGGSPAVPLSTVLEMTNLASTLCEMLTIALARCTWRPCHPVNAIAVLSGLASLTPIIPGIPPPESRHG